MKRKYWILYRDYGYSERSIYGVTARAATAKAWQKAYKHENMAVECTLIRDILPTEWID